MTMITAHAGADALPDNSLAYVRHALASAADALEIDVRRARDGSLRLGHDAADDGLPTLEEVFALLRDTPGKRVNCDLKEPGLQEAVCALAREHGLAGRVILTGTTDASLYAASPAQQEIAALWLNVELVVPGIYQSGADVSLRRSAAEATIAFCRQYGLSTVNLHYRLADGDFGTAMREAGLALSVWTVNEEADICRFLAGGVENLTTRNLAAALRLAGR